MDGKTQKLRPMCYFIAHTIVNGLLLVKTIKMANLCFSYNLKLSDFKILELVLHYFGVEDLGS